MNSPLNETKLTETEIDQLRRIEDKIARVTDTLIKVMPHAKRELLTTVAISLCDFWQIADNHRVRMWEMLRLEGPHDKLKLSQLLVELVQDDLKAHLPNHIESLEEVLPAMLEILDSDKK